MYLLMVIIMQSCRRNQSILGHACRQTGFTLTELLVVITMIAILSSVAAVSYSTIQKNNRDQKRLRDLLAVKQALELIRSDFQYYPYEITFGQPLIVSGRTYLNRLPDDTTANRHYIYKAFPAGCSGINCVEFVICAQSEGTSPTGKPDKCANLNCAGTSDDCNMGVFSD